MKRPASWQQARRQTEVHMHHLITGYSRQRKKQLLREYASIIEIIWRRWQVGIFSLQAMHVRWYLTEAVKDRSPGTQYRHWLRCREIIIALQTFDCWKPFLRGPWLNPRGEPELGPKLKTGRKPKYSVSRLDKTGA